MPTAIVFTADAGTDVLTATAHGLLTGDRFRTRNVGGTLPAPLAAVTTYFAIRIDANTLKVATTSAFALAGTAVNITTAGTGTHTLEYGLPYCEPRIATPGTQIYSADDNAAWDSLKAVHALFTGQTETVWGGDVKLAGDLEVSGLATLIGPIKQTGIVSPSALAAGNTDDYNPAGLATANVLRVTTDAAHSTLRGLAGGATGRRITLVNIGLSNGNLVLAHNDGGSTAGNRFFLPAASSMTIRPYGAVELWYDGAGGLDWRVLSANL